MLPPIPFRMIVDHVKIFKSSPILPLKIEVFVTKKIGNGWKLLLTVVI